MNPLGQKGHLALMYADLLDAMWKRDQTPINAAKLKERIVIKASQFQGHNQQDSQELILYMLDGLHERACER